MTPLVTGLLIAGVVLGFTAIWGAIAFLLYRQAMAEIAREKRVEQIKARVKAESERIDAATAETIRRIRGVARERSS